MRHRVNVDAVEIDTYGRACGYDCEHRKLSYCALFKEHLINGSFDKRYPLPNRCDKCRLLAIDKTKSLCPNEITKHLFEDED